MLTPQLSPDPIITRHYQPVGSGTNRPVYLSEAEVAAWIWAVETWTVQVNCAVSGQDLLGTHTLQNNNLSNPASKSALTLPGSVATTGSIPLGPDGLRVTLNQGSLWYDPKTEYFWPEVSLTFNSGPSSLATSGTLAPGNATICGIPIPLYGDVAEDAVISIYPNTTW